MVLEKYCNKRTIILFSCLYVFLSLMDIVFLKALLNTFLEGSFVGKMLLNVVKLAQGIFGVFALYLWALRLIEHVKYEPGLWIIDVNKCCYGIYISSIFDDLDVVLYESSFDTYIYFMVNTK